MVRNDNRNAPIKVKFHQSSFWPSQKWHCILCYIFCKWNAFFVRFEKKMKLFFCSQSIWASMLRSRIPCKVSLITKLTKTYNRTKNNVSSGFFTLSIVIVLFSVVFFLAIQFKFLCYHRLQTNSNKYSGFNSLFVSTNFTFDYKLNFKMFTFLYLKCIMCMPFENIFSKL